MIAARWHIREKRGSERYGRTLCGLYVGGNYTVRGGVAHEWCKPKIVSARKLAAAPLINKCSRCLRSFFGPKFFTEWWLQSDERREYLASVGRRAE